MKLIGTVIFAPYQQQEKILLIASLEKTLNTIIPEAAEAVRGRQSTGKVPNMHTLLGVPVYPTQLFQISQTASQSYLQRIRPSLHPREARK